MSKRLIKLLGTAEPGPKPRVLTAGALSATFSGGALRYIRWHGAEVLRGIAYLCRDKNWGTYAPEIEALKFREAGQGFTVSYRAICRDAEQAIAYTALIEGKADGTLVFEATGTPEADFLTNRTGFVVLHALEGVAGEPLKIEHTDGRKETARFPKAISPGQPVFDIRALTHSVMPGVSATVRMEGGKFEMEDHRNWMDASYKTYVCSLLDPWPYTLKKGEPFTQSISVTLSGKPKTKPKTQAKTIAVEIGGPAGAMPSIGLALPMREAAAALSAAELIAKAKPGHLVAQIVGGEAGGARAAAAFRELKRRTGPPLHLEVILPAMAPAEEEMAAIAEDVRAGGLQPDAVIVTQMHDLKSFQPGAPRPWGPSYEEMAAAARRAFPQAKIGGGMLSYFTELNRKPPPRDVFDFVTHSVCPIVHAADDVSVMETLEAIPSIAASARAIIGRAPYHIGPSAIAARDNPYGRAVTPNPGNGRVCLTDNDPRQRALFGAAWTLGLIAGFAEGGAAAICAGAATGKSGMIGEDGVTPLYRLIESLAAAQGAKRLRTRHGGGNRIATLAFRSASGGHLLLANLTAEPQVVKVKRLKQLELSPYAVAAIKGR